MPSLSIAILVFREPTIRGMPLLKVMKPFESLFGECIVTPSIVIFSILRKPCTRHCDGKIVSLIHSIFLLPIHIKLGNQLSTEPHVMLEWCRFYRWIWIKSKKVCNHLINAQLYLPLLFIP